MSALEMLYAGGVRALRPVLRTLPFGSAKLRRGIDGRRSAVEVLEHWAAQARAAERPLVWLHAPSVGEALMAQAILGAARARMPAAQYAFTWFSPSAERMARRVGADTAGYLPWDVRSDVQRTLDALQPSVIAFVRTEIWPVLTREADARGIPLALVNAVLARGSSRMRAPARWLLRAAYGRLAAVGAVAAEDATHLATLGVKEERLHLTGDARFDQVFARVQRLDRTAGLLARLRDGDRPTLVAGSTWDADVERLLPALDLARVATDVRVIIAPHEPAEAHLAYAEKLLRRFGIASARLAEVERGDAPLPPAVLVDRVGVLADLYALADAAYVGGGFGHRGLHSIIEPAALGVPVLFGPQHGNAREADELAAHGGGVIVRNADELGAALVRLLRDDTARAEAARRAAAYVTAKLGGAQRNADLILSLIPRPSPPTHR
jgi:3-deoxy-D-manno-octulosonic-acid transferase